MASTPVDYSIRSLCYAHVDLPAEFFGGVPIHSGDGIKTAAMHYVLLSSRDADEQEHHVLVDVGFADEEWIGRFGFYDWEPPETVLGRVGLEISQIEKVLVSHMHFDHINALGHFPDVELYLHRQEYDGWVEVLALPPHLTPMGRESWITSSFHREDLARLGEYMARGKLHFVESGEEVLPGVTAYLSGGHTFGNQWFSVETSGGTYAVAADAAFWYSNVEEMWPSGYTNGDTYRMLLTYGELYEHLDGEIDRIVPGHDMQIYERHPSWTDGTNQVAEVHVAGWDKSRKP
jgi:glyoxylase-like metal-dependent hydrolase (beta-lactamase superfamily II)